MTSDDCILERVRVADPAGAHPAASPPSFERVAAVRRRRATRNVARVGSGGTLLAVAAALSLALPGANGRDVIAQAAAALSGPGVLHTVTVTLGPDGRPSSRAETWHAPNGDQRTLVRSAGGTLIGEVTLDGDISSSWNANDNVLYRSLNTASDDDPLELLSKAGAGEPGVSQRDDTTIRGIPVHVIALSATTAGEDPVPERVYYIDKRTSLPVRFEFGTTVTDVLQAETLPPDQASDDLTMSSHPGATVRDFTRGDER
ncbi:hypothetical protein OM076_00935 [Solirubrobacter ginsenosidimutans]|uniref:Uncharacterized protein n=1 Tax=Solirubrobacter ginsenosidimutans TaxID=490573 RepID=A0A9X3MSG1_9ACTN|nr:hypothetical protein [Solirubrobacter ginsenosidimutans]MDA0158813.1 hypothetical protein [Solirubrobacter ginsenosidimutans]